MTGPRFLSYGHQTIGNEDLEAVVESLKSEFLTQGPMIDAFEQTFATVVAAPYAISCANGTAALHLASLAVLEPGDRVLCTPVSFVASANGSRYVGAEVEFADIEDRTFTLDPVAAEQALKAARDAGRPYRAIVTVDLAGHPCDMAAFARLRREYDLVWIEDACHALGAAWTDAGGRKRPVGGWEEVDLVVYSFHPVKHITTGEGGMITTHRQDLADRLKRLRSHGIVRDPAAFQNRSEAFADDGTPNPWYYEMTELGFNYRLSDFQAALGKSQLQRLPAFLTRRREIADRYRDDLKGLPHLVIPAVAPGVEHALHLALALIDFPRLGKDRARVMRELKARGVGTQVHYIPIPMMPAWKRDLSAFPRAVAYYRRTLSLPCFPGMTDEDVDRVIEAVRETLRP